ncbi:MULTISPECIES: type IV pilus modification protein PilV [unclassified Psychrobacter]|uniref:type IV pilus modification protein PilV n=1 Tax=unclassified Psychrobacter TaxID=196806 RepID=UPI003FCF9E0A
MNIKSSQRGVGLVEVLVAVLLLSVAVLGFSALQLRAISATDESLVRTQAMSVIRGLSENMRSNSLQLDTYEDAVNDPVTTEPTIGVGSCLSLADSCTDVQIAAKEAKIAVNKLKGYGIEAKMVTCPGTATVSFSEVKCIIAAWGDTKPLLSNGDDKACATESGIYKSGSTCSIIEAY